MGIKVNNCEDERSKDDDDDDDAEQQDINLNRFLLYKKYFCLPWEDLISSFTTETQSYIWTFVYFRLQYILSLCLFMNKTKPCNNWKKEKHKLNFVTNKNTVLVTVYHNHTI